MTGKGATKAAAALSSMTGFARADGAHGGWRYVWEVRSVNGRGLEWRSRLPPGFDALDPMLRGAAKEKLARGSLNVSLTLNSDQGEARFRINEAMLKEMVALISRIRSEIECAPPQAEGLLALRGVQAGGGQHQGDLVLLAGLQQRGHGFGNRKVDDHVDPGVLWDLLRKRQTDFT